MVKFLENKLVRETALNLSLLVMLWMLFSPNSAADLLGNNLQQWIGYTAFAGIGVFWILFRPLWGAKLEDAVNEAIVIASTGVIIATLLHWNGWGSMIPILGAVAFAFQAGRHRFNKKQLL